MYDEDDIPESWVTDMRGLGFEVVGAGAQPKNESLKTGFFRMGWDSNYMWRIKFDKEGKLAKSFRRNSFTEFSHCYKQG